MKIKHKRQKNTFYNLYSVIFTPGPKNGHFCAANPSDVLQILVITVGQNGKMCWRALKSEPKHANFNEKTCKLKP